MGNGRSMLSDPESKPKSKNKRKAEQKKKREKRRKIIDEKTQNMTPDEMKEHLAQLTVNLFDAQIKDTDRIRTYDISELDKKMSQFNFSSSIGNAFGWFNGWTNDKFECTTDHPNPQGFIFITPIKKISDSLWDGVRVQRDKWCNNQVTTTVFHFEGPIRLNIKGSGSHYRIKDYTIIPDLNSESDDCEQSDSEYSGTSGTLGASGTSYSSTTNS